ncbi:hypothetical protein KFK09_003068 [Dendrobium nobile]|uniref:Uncharacterized protein n=1 Tax=Dendrobium nobile TaxID=94219 RepID=A0A8T3C340_DENNO|nr:hypothetical protein KFK09_003068 [Dendrobium nobile]
MIQRVQPWRGLIKLETVKLRMCLLVKFDTYGSKGGGADDSQAFEQPCKALTSPLAVSLVVPKSKGLSSKINFILWSLQIKCFSNLRNRTIKSHICMFVSHNYFTNDKFKIFMDD